MTDKKLLFISMLSSPFVCFGLQKVRTQDDNYIGYHFKNKNYPSRLNGQVEHLNKPPNLATSAYGTVRVLI